MAVELHEGVGCDPQSVIDRIRSAGFDVHLVQRRGATLDWNALNVRYTANVLLARRSPFG
jgi:hypothetical protein